MIDADYCNQVGTEKQHKFVCFLASKAGYEALRYAVADALEISVSKCGRKVITVKDASAVISFLQKKLDGEAA